MKSTLMKRGKVLLAKNAPRDTYNFEQFLQKSSQPLIMESTLLKWVKFFPWKSALRDTHNF